MIIKKILFLSLGIFLFLGFLGSRAKLSGQEVDLDKQKARARLSQVKIVSLYENITDIDAFGRSLNDAVAQFKETRTAFIFRGF